MPRALLHVENQVYCEIDIGNAPMPATPNLVDSINIIEGFGQPVPVLEMYLYDQTGSLADEFALMEGKRIVVNIGKSADQTTKREFRVFGFSSLDTHAGPRLRVVCILDAYKFVAESVSKAFSGTSADAIRRVASECGLQYDGPESAADEMIWLNVCQNYLSFTEDVALHGYMGKKSCMYRILDSKKRLIYKDLFSQLAQAPEFRLMHNAVPGDDSKDFIIREMNTLSRGGIVSHWLNYGQAQYEHDLSGETVETLKLNAPITKGFPVHEVRDELEYSRKDMIWPDSGTKASKAGNVHRNYRQAYYQNKRFYALFTDGLSCLMDQFTDLTIAYPVKLECMDLKSGDFVQNERYSGSYLLTNKTIHIKNGVRYHEKLTVGRPNVGNAK